MERNDGRSSELEAIPDKGVGMKGEVVIRQAEAGELSEVKSLLQEARLPTAGLDNVEHLFVLESGGHVLGAVGFEAYPPYALLRSLVVAPQLQRQGHGRRLLKFLLNEVKTQGFLETYALTTTIPNWLSRLGFEEISRQDLPEALHTSVELLGACPASALVFRLRL